MSNTIREEGHIPPDYAFHVGGRDELQFNVGFDEEELRWGVAISLQASQAIPNPVEELSPKLDRLSEFIRVL